MRKLIHSVLGSTAAVVLVVASAACSRSRDANTASGVQTSTPPAERVNPGSGYYGAAPENVNRPSTAPTGMGGGPRSMDQSGGSSMGIDSSSGGTTGTGSDTDMNGGAIGGGPGDQSGTIDSAGGSTSGTGTDKNKKKKSGSTNGGTDMTGGGDKGSGTTGGTQQK